VGVVRNRAGKTPGQAHLHARAPRLPTPVLPPLRLRWMLGLLAVSSRFAVAATAAAAQAPVRGLGAMQAVACARAPERAALASRGLAGGRK
jgi:hypothetical protein